METLREWLKNQIEEYEDNKIDKKFGYENILITSILKQIACIVCFAESDLPTCSKKEFDACRKWRDL